jgi:GNAT superfamily N-acetyltransferase
MRALTEGIRVERARSPDSKRVRALVLEGIESYREWAPEWTPSEPPRERRRELEALFDGDEAWILMALADDELVGVVSLAPHTGADPQPPPPGTIYLWQLFVRPALQGSGLAGALMDRAIQEARRRGFGRLTLWAAEGAAQARRFYEREGWTPTGRRDDGARFGLPLVEYELRLGPKSGGDAVD